MALRVRNNLAIVVGGCQQVSVWKILFGQRTGTLIKIRGSELDEFGQARLLTHLSDGPAHQFSALLRGIRRNLVREILDHVQPAFAPDGGDARDIESAIKQVFAVRGRVHQSFMDVRGASSEGDILAGAIDFQ